MAKKSRQRSVKRKKSNVRAAAEESVSFAVLVRPRSGATLEEMQRNLSLQTVRSYQPDKEAVERVKKQLWAKGFEVFDLPGPVVVARASKQLFSQVFNVKLVTQVTKTRLPGSREVLEETRIILADREAIAEPPGIPDALMITLAENPTLSVPSLPPSIPGLNLRLPGDIALLTRASAAHRQQLTNGDRATGGGITVAVIDSGFEEHPYYAEHGYRITRMAASDTADPAQDNAKHGTLILAGLFACAPDVEALAVKYKDALVAIKEAVAHSSAPRIVSLSWGFPVAATKSNLPTVPINLVVYQVEILTMIADGITFIAAAGNLGNRNFPAMMPEVIAVGGVTVDAHDTLLAHDGSSSFTTKIFPGRSVPDVCGFAGEAVFPTRTAADGFTWVPRAGFTSVAVPQVAGVAALLLQKKPTLTPQDIHSRLRGTARDVQFGTSATKQAAAVGDDPATGAGFVNALDAWTATN